MAVCPALLSDTTSVPGQEGRGWFPYFTHKEMNCFSAFLPGNKGDKTFERAIENGSGAPLMMGLTPTHHRICGKWTEKNRNLMSLKKTFTARGTPEGHDNTSGCVPVWLYFIVYLFLIHGVTLTQACLEFTSYLRLAWSYPPASGSQKSV